MSSATLSPTPRTPPWRESSQWRADAENWIRAELARLGHPVTGPIEDVKIWGISCVLRARTGGETGPYVYFKTSLDLPLFVHEPVVTRELATLFPRSVPMPLAIEEQRGWMLLADFGPTVDAGLGNERVPLEKRRDVLCDFGRIQREAAPHTDRLLQAGAKDRRLPMLVRHIDTLCAALENPACGLKPDEVDNFRERAAPYLRGLCEKLAGYAVPHTLLHGDLHFGNIAQSAATGNRPLYFDWTDTCIAHPFFDMIEVWRHGEHLETDAPLRDAYLSLWKDYESPERLREAWEIAGPLTALHHAVSYYHISAFLAGENATGLEQGLPQFLHRILEQVP